MGVSLFILFSSIFFLLLFCCDLFCSGSVGVFCSNLFLFCYVLVCTTVQITVHFSVAIELQ